MEKGIARVLISEEAIARRVGELGAQITEDYRGKKLMLVGVLKGSAVFMADLMRHIPLPLVTEFVAVSSYAGEVRSTGRVRILKDVETSVEDVHVLLVEDIIDSGLTLAFLRELFAQKGALSFKTAALLDKPGGRAAGAPSADYTGFTVAPVFVVGYGMDAGEVYRNLPYVGVYDPGGAEAR